MRTYTVQNVKITMQISVELIIKYFVTIGLGKIMFYNEQYTILSASHRVSYTWALSVHGSGLWKLNYSPFYGKYYTRNYNFGYTASCFKNTRSLFNSRRTVNCGLKKTLIYFFLISLHAVFLLRIQPFSNNYLHTYTNPNKYIKLYFMCVCVYVCLCVIKYYNSRPTEHLFQFMTLKFI